MPDRQDFDARRREWEALTEAKSKSRGKHLKWTIVSVVAVGIMLGLLLQGLDSEGGPHPGHSSASPSTSPGYGQAAFQARIVDDRKKLFAGSLRFDSHLSTSVGSPIICYVSLTALGEEAASASGTDQPVAETREFQVGGVEGATLASTSTNVKVGRLHNTGTKQVIAEPGDLATWWWTLSASEPGDYDLVLVITTYQGNSDRALATLEPPITIHLTVHNTTSHRVSSIRNLLITWGGVAMAVAALFAFRTPLVGFARARRDTWQEKRKRGQDGYM